MKLFLSSFLISSVSPWELPSFVFDGLPQIPLEEPRELEDTDLTVLQPFIETMQPTESPAPSPSPSEVPTQAPTLTPQPTRKPSAMPTESPAPSPSPSETPTDMPSDSPSAGPTIAPTVSARPSTMPSTSPSQYPTTTPSAGPTMSPTVSSAPSDHPSQSPTESPSFSPSVSPSSSPTFVAPVNATLFMALPIEVARLKSPQIEVVQRVAGYFFQDIVENTGGGLQDVTVTIMEQEPVEVTDDEMLAFMKQQVETLSTGLDLHQALNMTIDVVASYAGSDMDFDLKEVIENGLSQDHSLLFQLLSQEDKVFSALSIDSGLTGRSVPGETSVYSPRPKRRGMSGGSIAFATLMALGAMALGVAASIFSLRSYRTATYGKELLSPHSQSSSSLDIIKAVPSKKQRRSFEPVQEEDDEEEGPEFDIESMQDSVDNKSPIALGVKKSTSWNDSNKGTFDRCGGLTFNQLLPHQYSGKEVTLPPAPSISQSWSKSSQQRAKDPPTAASEVNFGTKNDNNMGSVFDNDTAFTDSTRGRGSMSSGFKDDTLGAKEPERNYFERSSGYNSSNPYGTEQSTTPLGARAVGPDEVMQLREKSSYDSLSVSKRPGLYDVFAPAGPIGIVVDTTKYGPAVHSLKRTSPMLGLINPGDLIVGLDDEDTRGMTAATLTRLMARKSNQKERKITLLTVE